MITLTADQFKKKFGEEAISAFDSSNKIQPKVNTSLSGSNLSAVKGFKDANNTLKEASQSYLPDLMKTYAGTVGLDSETGQWGKPDFIKAAESSKIQEGSIGANGKPRTKFEAGVARVGEGALRSTASLLSSIFAPITQGVTSLADASTNNPNVQKFSMDNPIGSTMADVGQKIDTWKQEHPEESQNIDSALAILLTAVGGGKGGIDKPVSEIFKSKQSFSGSTKPPAPPSAPSSIESSMRIPTTEVSAGIMNRVARLKPTDMTTFEKMSGKTPGQYLTETGNFGATDKIISTEAVKFSQSKAMVDAEFAKLPGVYKDGSIKDALSGLLERAKNTSSENVKSPITSQVEDLMKKYEAGGLTMDEINTVKRLYEREVKLGYNKLLNPDKVQIATNIDNTLRQWQLQKARDLGFKNVDELNKQTQISKFIVNKLGDQVIGQSGLNSIGLTDWIVLGGGNPSAVAGFLTKRFFSSRAVQAKIAEFLNKGEQVKGMVQPNVSITPENIIRRQFPEGPKLELPEGKTKVPTGTNPINLRGASSMEAPAQKIYNESMVGTKSNTKTQPLPQQGKVGKTSSSNTLPQSEINASLINEAKKYKTAEELLNDTRVFHGGDTKFVDKLLKTKNFKPDAIREAGTGGNMYGLSTSKNYQWANDFKNSSTGNGKVAELYINPEAKVFHLENKAIDDLSDLEIKQIAKKYDVIRDTNNIGGENETRILNPRVLRDEQYIRAYWDLIDTGLIPNTKSQLTDIWNKANK